MDEKKRLRIAYLFFDVISLALKESGKKMEYDTWQKLPDEIKENYLREADKVLEIMEV